jgi:hypothetical protein
MNLKAFMNNPNNRLHENFNSRSENESYLDAHPLLLAKLGLLLCLIAILLVGKDELDTKSIRLSPNLNDTKPEVYTYENGYVLSQNVIDMIPYIEEFLRFEFECNKNPDIIILGSYPQLLDVFGAKSAVLGKGTLGFSRTAVLFAGQLSLNLEEISDLRILLKQYLSVEVNFIERNQSDLSKIFVLFHEWLHTCHKDPENFIPLGESESRAYGLTEALLLLSKNQNAAYDDYLEIVQKRNLRNYGKRYAQFGDAPLIPISEKTYMSLGNFFRVHLSKYLPVSTPVE